MANYNFVLTTKGIALYAKVQAGTTLNFTRCAIGDGTLGSGQSAAALTALINLKKYVTINQIIVSGEYATIRAVVTNEEVTSGFYMREFGIYATDPTDGEILFAVAEAGEESDYLPAYGNSNLVQVTYDHAIVVGSTTDVTVSIDTSVTYVTRQEFETHTNATGVHGATPLPTVNRLILRDSNGRAQVAAPSAAADIARKIDVDTKAPISHASAAATYGVANASNYGHAKASSTTPVAAGTAAVGAEVTAFARGDHVHPAQTSVSGNAGTATKLANARTIALSGAVTGSGSFDGGGNLSIATSAAPKKFLNQIPRYSIKHNSTDDLTDPDDFTSYDPITSFLSFGGFLFSSTYASSNAGSCGIGSLLLEMNINVVTAKTVTQKLRYIDDNIYFYLDGTLIDSEYETAGVKNKTISWVLTTGNHTIQIVLNNSVGGLFIVNLFGDIIDGEDVLFVVN
jgi:hypothetical protein